MANKVRKSGKKNRKHGRNADWCKAYRARDQRGRNKAKKLLRHIKRYGATDHMAVHCFNNLAARAILGLPAITPEKRRSIGREVIGALQEIVDSLEHGTPFPGVISVVKVPDKGI